MAGTTSSKVLQELLDTVASLTSLSDKDRDSIDTQVKVMMRQIKGAIEELESLEQGSHTLLFLERVTNRTMMGQILTLLPLLHFF